MRVGPLAVVLCCSLFAVAAASGALALSESGAPAGDGSSTLERIDAATPPDSGFESTRTQRCPTGPTNETRATAADLETVETPRIAELYPNTRLDGNAGEYFVLEIPETAALGNWTITDGHTTAAIPADSPAGRVAYSLDPAVTDSLTTHPVRELDGHLRLSAEGDDLELRNAEAVLDRVSYDSAPVGERWHRSSVGRGNGSGRGVWWPRMATCLDPVSVSDVEATAFALPDSPDVVREAVGAAQERILLGAYTFTDEAVAAELAAAAERGVDVEVVVEASPVGGMPRETRPVLDSLTEAGVDVRVVGGEGSRYAYHHPKYAVVDDRALVTTENWDPAGVGGTSSRGWGVTVASAELAAELESVFRADAEGPDVTDWERYRSGATFVEDGPPGSPYPAAIEPETVAVEEAELLLAPDNAEQRFREELRDAEESILIKQARIGDRRLSLLAETLEAARDGVEVRILLDDSWYVEEENSRLADWLAGRAEAEDLPLEVRLVESGSAFEKVHAKGVVVDGETAVVGSVNWNANSLRENREVALVLEGEAVAGFYADVFEADWGDETWPVPIDLLAVVAVVLASVGYLGWRYVDYGPRGQTGGIGVDPEGERFGDRAASASERVEETPPRRPSDQRVADTDGEEPGVRAIERPGSNSARIESAEIEAGGADDVLSSRAGRRSRAPRRGRRRPSSRRERR